MSINRQRNSHSVRKRIIKKAIVVLLVIGIPFLLFLFIFGIRKVDVVGENRYTDKQIRELVLKSKLDYNSILLFLKYRFLTTPKIPFIEKLDVEMNSNHEVTIYVYEKIVTGCVNVMGEYLYFDKDGIVVESSPDKIEKVPVIEGLKFNKIVLHQKLNLQNIQGMEQSSKEEDIQDQEQDRELIEKQNDEIFRVILNITRLINKNELDVDAVRFDEDENVTLKCGEIKVLLGKKSDYDAALSDLKNILKKVKDKQIYELDMRDYEKGTGYVIGKTKNSTE